MGEPRHGAHPAFRWSAAFAIAAAAFAVAVVGAAELADAQATQLKFIQQPTNAGAGEPFTPVVQVGVYSSSNTLVTSGTHTVTLTLQAAQDPATCPGTFGGAPRPCGRLLYGATAGQQGAVQATTTSGIATFTGLHVDALGKGYRIQATATGLASATSNYFDVTAGQMWPQLGRDAAHSAAQSFAARMSTPSVLTPLAGPVGRPIRASPAVVDLDRDGLLDIVTVSDFVNVPSGTPIVTAYRQSPPGTFSVYWTHSAFPSLAQVKDGRAVLAVGDLSNPPDNVPEVVVYWAGFTDTGAYAFLLGEELRALNGQTGALLATYSPCCGTLIDPPTPVIGDTNGDGNNEVVIIYQQVGGFARAGNGLAVLRLGSGTFTVVAAGGIPGQPFSCAPFVTCTYGASFFTAPPVLAEVRSAHAGLEVIIASNHAVTPPAFLGTRPPGVVFLCTPTSVINCTEILTLCPSTANQNAQACPHVTGMGITDLDADGTQELVANARYVDGTGAPANFASLNVVSLASPMAIQSQHADGFLWNQPALGDLGGDGKPDIATAQHAWDTAHAPPQGDVRMRSRPSGTMVDHGTLLRPIPPGQTSTQAVGGSVLVDLDYVTGATPRLEQVLGSLDRTVAAATLSTSSTPALFWTTSPSTGASTPWSPPVAADLSGDCAPEILVGLDSGNLARITGLAAGAPAMVPNLNAAITGPPWTSPGQGVQAKVYWNAPSGDGGMPILSYRVLRATAPAGPYAEVGVWRGLATPTQANPFTDTTIPAPGDYYYKVRAVNCVGAGADQPTPFWAEVKVPQLPGNLDADPYGMPAYGAPTSPRTQLTWTPSPPNASPPNGCGAVQGYNVYRATSSPVPLTAANRLNPTLLASTSFLDTTPTYGLHWYAVAAVNCVGEAASEILVDLRPPSGVTIDLTPGGTTMTVAWDPPASFNGCKDAARPNGWIEGYRVYRGTTPGSPTLIGTVFPNGPLASPPEPWRALPPSPPPGSFTSPVTFMDFGLTVGTTYYYQVSAVNCVGEGPLSPEVSEEAGGSPLPLVVALNPPAKLGLASTVFTVTPSVTGGTPVYTCTWSVSPPGGTFTPPTGAQSCTAPATFTGGVGGTTYTVMLSVQDAGVQSGTATSLLTVNPPVSAALEATPPEGSPRTIFSLTPDIVGGLPPITCTWSVSPAGGTLLPPTGASSCTEPASFWGGVAGTLYTATVVATDASNPAVSSTASATFRIRANDPPVASFSASPQARPGQAVTFSDLSYDRDGTIESWLWDFGDGTTSRVPSPSHVFDRAGAFRVRLTVVDNDGEPGETLQEIRVDFGEHPPTTRDEPTGPAGGSGGGVAAPVADAGPDLVVLESTRVSLAAHDVQGQAYLWRQADGLPVTLDGANTPTASFTAPRLPTEEAAVLRFVLQVSTGGQDSSQDTVEVIVRSANHPPVAEAGPDGEARPGDLVLLDATSSWDADGPITYRWRQVEGPAVELRGGTTPGPTFVAPEETGLLRFELEVSDGRATAVDGVSVWVKPPAPVDTSFTVESDPKVPGRYSFHAAARSPDAEWDLGDGTTARGADVEHTYAEPGDYQVTLRLGQDASTASTQSVRFAPMQSTAASAEESSGVPAWGLAVGAVGLVLVAVAVLVVARRRR